MNIQKVILFSTMVSVNMIIWYEILGMKFLVGVLIVVMYLLLLEEGDHDKTGYSNRRRGIGPIGHLKKYRAKKKLER